ncbi:MAG: UDP-glucose 4-epimerase GalE [Cyanobacteriota bacterium]|nr:UDP-glucose 4-epimerase GalE [Cyanobacteriota bacterium]MDY6358163.1 UDP-glucose 4-epimerase GalE [Cyanobacteriota bacterium]MDY6364378.1 UDP-glucose 4-epimerase GalE [Cyanobacteriota bacterium]MDY6383071.1 UDP-glucose 4-epimerase GalE [Cyanobacteriota bacterium]
MILVTGGAGYIGSHCVMALLEKGFEVIIFDNLSTGHIETVQTLQNYGNLRFVQGDLLNQCDLKSLFEQNNIDAVIHFAAFSQVAESVKNPKKYYINNVVGTLNLLNAMLDHNVKNIVFSSTAATYGEPVYTPIDEKHPQNPINPYGQTKLTIEKIMDDYNKAYSLKSVRLRYFNVAGADSKSRIGEWHDPETHLIPNILKSTFSGGKTFQMFGDDYNTKDGTCVRDYINVEDLANAHLLALKYLENGGETNYFNLGTNEGNTVKEVFALCEKVTNREIPIEIKPRRQGDPAVLVADNKKAKEVLGWQPEKTLENSIQSAYDWEKILQNRLK